MDLIIYFKALILGIIEGVTEFLPVSSTGHLIIFGDLIHFQSNGFVFEVAIQLGAVLAVVFEYRKRFKEVFFNIGRDKTVNRFVINLIVAFIPAAIVGVIFSSKIKEYLFNPVSVAIALIIGGFIIIWAERYQAHRRPNVSSVDNMRIRDALMVGIAQICALIPGTSRSGSTIIGGMIWGLDRKVATEFSFFLAVPVMVAATFYDVAKNYKNFSGGDIDLIIVGFIAAFFSGLFAVKALLKFLATRNYIPFAYYRIALGSIILVIFSFGWI